MTESVSEVLVWMGRADHLDALIETVRPDGEDRMSRVISIDLRVVALRGRSQSRRVQCISKHGLDLGLVELADPERPGSNHGPIDGIWLSQLISEDDGPTAMERELGAWAE